MLADIFGLLRLWHAEGGAEDAATQGLTAFPGALIRALVHKFDAIALAPGAVRRHAAISQTVARRAGYFPAGVDVTVVPHPSNLEVWRPRRWGRNSCLPPAASMGRNGWTLSSMPTGSAVRSCRW